jgi:hypothetical protein
MKYILAVLLLISCGTKELKPAKPRADYPELRAQVERVEPLLAWTCDGMIPARSQNFPCIKEGDGVSMLGRIIADTGDRSKLPAIRASIGQDGRLWRNPERVGNDGPNSASRDAFIGLLETRDKDSIKRVMAYIKATGRLCPGDDRCDVTPSVRFLAEETLGVAHTKAEIAFDIETLWLEAETAPPTYRAYLVGRKLLAHIRLGNLNSGYARVAKRLNERFPRNPFLAYVNAVANKKSFDPIAKDLTACLAAWQKPGIDWWGDAMNGCTSKQQGHELVALGKLLLGP